MNKSGSRLAGIIVALALAMGLAACGALKLGYSNFPSIAHLWLDGYVDFDDTQSPLAREALQALHGWHRQHELPKWVALLARVEGLAAGPITPPQACGVLQEGQALLNNVAPRAEPAVLALAASLQPRQLRHIERKYRRNNERFHSEWIADGPAAHREKRYEQLLDRIERIYGRLGRPQREVLRRGVEQSMYEPQRILAERQRRQQDLLATLRQLMQPALPAAEAARLLRGYLERAQHSPDPGYRAWQQALVQEGCQIFAAVHQSTTPEQREEAVRRLRAYQRALQDLSGPH